MRVILFYPSMDTKGVDCSEGKRPSQRDTNKTFCLSSRAIARPGERGPQLSPSSRLPRCFAVPPGLGQKAVLHASVRETNRRPFWARCGGYPIWIVLDNQHP
ncbi:hypothetical protein [Aneurinibacillus migulanus]|uniref:hypothetical protein n=1 Tax=Aneurinibacillus migulanus TaxID=47500 RepID=UPI000AA19228|nr:hypothetical protein [Aneurinibacillus migulanus]MED0894248.1 hypothetical protein [Aneurinibacillus migulanus]MED1616926.1 hypothetical protein [Aneurinibacillus migulanus]MED4729608.1 hypothetical protein [Aneurinibacillus migulanus]